MASSSSSSTSDKEKYGLPVTLAVGLHLLIFLVTFFAVDFHSENQTKIKDKPIVQAKVIDIEDTIIGQRLREEAEAAKVARQKAEEDKRQAERKAQQEKQKQLEQARRAKQAEQDRQAQLAAKKAAEEKRIAQEKKAAEEKARQEQERLALEARKKEEAERAEQQRQKELEETRRKEAARIAEEERKRQEEAKKALAEEQARLEAEEAEKAIQAEEQRRRDEEEQQMVQSLTGLINERIRAGWIRPPNAKNGMQTTLDIHFLPNGEVRDVFIVKSSGDNIFDSKTVDAVYKVRRIEELAELDSYIFERNFRQITIIFNPQDLRN